MQSTPLHLAIFSYVFCSLLLQNRLLLVSSGRNTLQKRSVTTAFFSNKSLTDISGNQTSCRWLRGYKFQNEMCRRTKGFAEVLRYSRVLAVEQCEEQFRYERWKCSYSRGILKKVYRETAFLHAISSAAIMYSIAKACSEKRLKNCKCAPEQLPENTDKTWRWGGCGDNSHQARKLAKRFLQLGQKGDGPRNILNYNSLVGMEIVAKSETKVCTCHGVSASCAFKTCYKKLETFKKIAETLKQRYHTAIKLSSSNTIKQTVRKRYGNLLYFTDSPDFCSNTARRQCNNAENCATLCCGRGYVTEERLTQKRCRCRWHKCCMDVKCDTCEEITEIYICK